MSHDVTEPRRPLSVARELGEALGYVVHVESVLALGTLAMLVATFEWASALPWLPQAPTLALARVGPLVYFFAVLRKAARGSRRLPTRDDLRDRWDGVVLPLLQLAVVSAWHAVLPLVVAVRRLGWARFIAHARARPLALLRQAHLPTYLALGGAVLLLPASLVATTATLRVAPLLDPTFGVRSVARIGLAYRRTFSLVCVLVLVAVACDSLGHFVYRVLPIPFAGDVLRHCIWLWVPLAQARLLGALAWREREALVGLASR